MKPITVEVLAHAPTAYYHCLHCEFVWHGVGLGQSVHREQLDSSLPEDLQAEYRELIDGIQRLVNKYCGQVVVKVVDAASLEGMWKALKYGARRLPVFVIDGREKVVGLRWEEVETVLDRRLAGVPG